MRTIFFLISLFIQFQCLSQFKFDYNDSIPVKIGNDTLLFPWAGGLNFVQVSDIDFDFDGDMDLFIFDRSKDNIRLFETVTINGTPKYKFVQNAYTYFPSDTKNRAALLDYDGDGKNDLFTYGIGGVKVYRNVGNASNGLQWQLIYNLLYSDYIGSYTNLYVSSSDIPAYVDVDFDTDIDILTFSISGQRIEYHQNQSMELYGHNDSLVFVLKNECWGTFSEDPNNNSLILNDPTAPCNAPNVTDPQKASGNENPFEQEIAQKTKRHAGSTILAIDIDNSGVYDLVLGDVSHDNLVLVVNGGTAPNTNSAMISQDENFPSNTTPAALTLFPASFYVDVDHDQIKDLIVGANAKGVSQNEKGILCYKNLGTNELPNFIFKSKSFLQEDMIENGVGSIPVFFDQNGDGKEDLLVANFYRYKEPLLKESALSHYRNTGTPSAPFFTFVENNYLNLLSQSYGLRTIPTFGDIDQDGDKDLFLGLENGTVVFYQNIASSGAATQFATPVQNYTDNLGNIITTSSYCFPQLFDLDNDGLLDLLLGKKTGEIMYYKNIGNATNPSFSLVNDTLGGIDISPTTPEGYAAPHFFRYNDTTNLFLGGSDGKCHYYNGIDNHLNSGEIFNLVSDEFRGIHVENYSSFYVNDIDQDGNLNLFVGGDLGGVMHFEHNPISTSSLEDMTKTNEIILFPNPGKDAFTLLFQDENISKIDLIVLDANGRIVYENLNLNVNLGKANFNLETENGVYFVKILMNDSESIEFRKLVIQR